MLGEHTAAIASYMGWWADAGVTDAVADAPHDWMGADVRRAPAVRPEASKVHVAPPVAALIRKDADPALGDAVDLAAFDGWLAEAPALPGRNWSDRLVLPEGPADAPLMLLADVPDAGDIEAERLFSGNQGKLLDAMLAAIGLRRGNCRLGSIAFTRPIAGKIDAGTAPALMGLAQRHVALARPRALLLLGPQAAQLMTGEGLGAEARQRDFNQDGAITAAFAIHHPRLLLERPLLKRGAWEVLKLVREHVQT